jgi:hypothetical protein
MSLAVVFQVWASFGAWLFMPTVKAPPSFGRAAISLCGLELLATAIWSFGSESCVQRPCGVLPETARTAAALDIPTLTAIGLALAAIYGFRRARAMR